MARLVGFISNRSELGSQVLNAYADALRTTNTHDGPLGWGIGFHQFGEVLLRRRPLDERKDINLADAANGIKTDIMIGHIRQPTVGNLRTENTHPFRYRQWLFAQTGTLVGFESVRERLMEIQPAFLRPNVRGDTDSELFFYLFLSYLHDEGHLDRQQVPTPIVHQALRDALKLVDDLCVDAGVPRHNGDILLTNGETLMAVHRSGKMALLDLHDPEHINSLLNPDPGKSNPARNLDQVRCSVIASELPTLPEGWTRVETDTITTATRTEAPTTSPVEG